MRTQKRCAQPPTGRRNGAKEVDGDQDGTRRTRRIRNDRKDRKDRNGKRSKGQKRDVNGKQDRRVVEEKRC